MKQILGLIIVLAVLSALFWILETLFAARPQQANTFKRRGFTTDLMYWFATPFITRSVTQIGIVLILMMIYRTNANGIKALLENRHNGLAALPAIFQIPLMLFIGDFISYWLHRAFHRGRLWRFHAVHHSSEDLDWLASVRVHPVNTWLTRWAEATVLVLLGFSPMMIATYVPFLTFYALLLHANVSWNFGIIGNVIASPRFHQWHHTSESEGLDKNFAGLFPIWDRIFRTYYMPQDRLPQHFGLKNEVISQRFLGQLIDPFKASN